MAKISRQQLEAFALQNPERYLEVFGDNDPLDLSGDLRAALEVPPVPAEEPTLFGEVGKGFKSGVSGTAAGLAGLGAMGAEAVGAEGVRDYLLESYQRNQADADANAAAVPSYKDVDGFGDAALYAAGGLGQLAPSLLLSAVTGGAGGLLARGAAVKAGQAAAQKVALAGGDDLLKAQAQKAVADKIIARAATAGSMGAEGSVMGGDTFGHNAAEGDYGLLKPLAVGLGSAALAGVVDSRVVNAILGRNKAGVARTAGTVAGLESFTEIGQTGMQNAAQGDPLTQGMIDAGILGALGGGVIGGAARAIGGAPAEDPLNMSDPLGDALSRAGEQRNARADERGLPLLPPDPVFQAEDGTPFQPTDLELALRRAAAVDDGLGGPISSSTPTRLALPAPAPPDGPIPMPDRSGTIDLSSQLGNPVEQAKVRNRGILDRAEALRRASLVEEPAQTISSPPRAGTPEAIAGTRGSAQPDLTAAPATATTQVDSKVARIYAERAEEEQRRSQAMAAATPQSMRLRDGSLLVDGNVESIITKFGGRYDETLQATVVPAKQAKKAEAFLASPATPVTAPAAAQPGVTQATAPAAPPVTAPAAAPAAAPAVAPVAEPSATQPSPGWQRFKVGESLNVPRAEMPQIKAGDRSSLVQFVRARGVESAQETVDPSTLRPTQQEFSPAKVAKAREFVGEDRAILVSSDNRIIDGHHQWVAKREAGAPIRVIRLKQPASELLPMVREFPSATFDQASAGSTRNIAAAPMPGGVSTGNGAQSGQAPVTGGKEQQPDVEVPADGRAEAQGAMPDAVAPAASRTPRVSPAERVRTILSEAAEERGEEPPKRSRVVPPPAKLAGARLVVGQTFGKNTVFYETDDANAPNGFVDPEDSGTLYVNVNAERPVMRIMMHELLHALRQTNPKAYRALLKAVKDVIGADAAGKWRDTYLTKRTRKEGGGYEGDIPDAMVIEEIMADAMGDYGSTQEFWEKLSGRMEPSLFQRVVQTFARILQKMMDALGKRNDLGSKRYFADMKVVQDALLEFADAGRRSSAAARPATEQKPLAAQEQREPQGVALSRKEAAADAGPDATTGRSYKLDLDRSDRATNQVASISSEERAAVGKDAAKNKLSIAQIERVLQSARETKKAFPVSDGWAPLKLAGISVDGDKVEPKWAVISYGFNRPAGIDRAPMKLDEKHAKAVADKFRGLVQDVYERAERGDKNAQTIVAHQAWYRNVTEVLRREYGANGDLLSDLLGATSPNTPVGTNWKFSVDALRRFMAGDFNAEMKKFTAYIDSGKPMKDYPQADKIRQVTGKLYGMNSVNAMKALADMWRIIEPGSAPKARNFALNLIGQSNMATIDVWAARMLRRSANAVRGVDLPRIPPPAESGVTGTWNAKADGVSGEFGFGARVMDIVSADMQAAGFDVTPPDLQAIAWFVEKELWGRNRWTSAMGEGGSFEEEIEKNPVERFIAGWTTQQGTREPDAAEASIAQARVLGMLIGDPTVTAARVMPTAGLYADQVSMAYDTEWTAQRGKHDPSLVMAEIAKLAKENNQVEMFVSRVLRPDENSPNARPGVEVYFKTQRSLDEAMPALKSLVGSGQDGFTLAVDPRAKGPDRYIGVRLQFIPEIAMRGNPELRERLMDDVQRDAVMAEKAKEMLHAVRVVRQTDGVAYAAVLRYDTVVIGEGDYDGFIDRGSAGPDRGAGGRVWFGRPLREGLEGAASRHESERGQERPGRVRGGGGAARFSRKRQEVRAAASEGRRLLRGGSPGSAEAVAWDYAGASERGSQDGRGLGVTVVGRFTASEGLAERLRNGGVRVPALNELEQSAGSAAIYGEAISASKADTQFGAAVFVYSEDDYAKMRLFLDDAGRTGFALKGDDIVSVFSRDGGNAVTAMLFLAVQEGGARLDCFDTVLPEIYSRNGFKPVSRQKWDDDYAPDGWDKETFSVFNNGEPDVVFMVYDRDYHGEALSDEGVYADSYDDAVELQMAARQDASKPKFSRKAVTPDAQAAAVRAKYEGAEQWMKAPNGKKTKLSEDQWVQVRTPNFKKWFGDWEKFSGEKGGVWNDGDKAVSKVVDENGEPLVVYHGSKQAGFNHFDPKTNSKGDFGTFFSSSPDTAVTYSGSFDEPEITQRTYDFDEDYQSSRGVYPVFLNIRDPHEEHFEGANWDGTRQGMFQVLDEDGENIYDDSGRGIFNDEDDAQALADKHEGAEALPAEDLYRTTDDVVREARKYGNDGAIIREAVDDGPMGYGSGASDIFVIFDSTQAKSATQNTGAFSRRKKDIRFSRKQVETPEFKAWSNGAPVFDPEQLVTQYSGGPLVAMTYHATTADVKAFDMRKANVESDMGRAIYTTNKVSDANTNYGNDQGPDLRQKIDRDAERMVRNGAVNEDGEEMNYSEAVGALQDRYIQNQGNVMPVYVALQNPAVLGGPGQTRLDFDESLDPETEEYGEPTGTLVDFADAIRGAMNDGDQFIVDGDADALYGQIMEHGRDYGFMNLADAIELAKDSGELDYTQDTEDGLMARGEVIRQALKEMGFDGIVDRTVNKKFGTEKGRGAGMAGMGKDTVHVLAFKPTQVKSAIGNRGTFSSDDRRVAFSRKQVDTPEFKRWFGDSKVVDENGEPMRVYTGTSKDKDFEKFNAPRNGVWFTTDPASASSYAADNDSKALKYNPDTRGYDRLNDAARVIPAYLSIKNPAELNSERSEKMRHAQNYKKAQREIFDELKREGYDGVKMDGGVWVAFEPEQIKSAIGNNGDFNPDDKRIRFSRAAAGPRSEPLYAGTPPMELGEETLRDRLTRRFVNNMNRVDKAREYLESKGAKFDDASDVATAETLYYGKTGEMLRQLDQKSIKPLLELVKRAENMGLSVKDVDDYLIALHAEERNRQVAKVNPGVTDGSGMSNADAAKIKAMHSGPRKAALDAVSAAVQAMHRDRIDMLRQFGLTEDSTLNAWTSAYKNYVPLKTVDEEPDALGTGMGYDIRGNESKRALGRADRATSPLMVSILDAQRTIIRAQKAEVGRSILKMAEQDTGNKLFEIKTQDQFRTQVFNSATGKAQDALDTGAMRDAFAVKVGGKVKFVVVKDELLRQQIQKIGANDVGPMLRVIGKLTRTLSKLYTQYNPSFILVNAVRDAITAGVNAKAYDRVSSAAVLRKLPKAWKAIAAVNFGKGSAEWKGLYEEFLEDGASSGGFGLDTIRDLRERAERDFRLAVGQNGLSRSKQAWHAVVRGTSRIGEIVSNANEVFENAARLSMYAEARAKGYTRQQAARMAKEVTVNFNRKGEWGSQINSAFMFFNAAVQGNRALYTHMQKSPKVKAAVFSIGALGFILAALNDGMDEDDETLDEVENKLADWELDHSAVLFLDSTGERVKFPLPYGYNVAFVMGRRAYRFLAGKDGAQKTAIGITTAFYDSFMPLGGSANDATMAQAAVRTMLPTIGTPFFDMAVNRDQFGRPITKEVMNRYDANVPDSQRYFRGVTPLARALTEALNEATGGSKVKAGGIDINPEYLDFWVKFGTGGAGSTLAGAGQLFGDDPSINRAPIVKAFYGAEPDYYVSSRFNEIRRTTDVLEGRMRDGDDTLSEDEMRVARASRQVGLALNRLYKRRKAAEARGGDTEELELQIERQQRRLIRAFNEEEMGQGA